MRTSLFFLLVAFVLIGQVAARTVVVIDDFEPARAPVQTTVLTVPDENDPNSVGTSTNGEFQDENPSFPIVGGQRDVYLTLTAGQFVTASVFVTGSQLSGAYAQDSLGVVRVSWDGAADTRFNEPDPSPGLNGFDLTISNSFALYLEITTDHEVEYTFTIYSNGGADQSLQRVDVPDVGDDTTVQTFLVMYNNFITSTGAGADFASVDAIEMLINFNISGAIDTGIDVVAIFQYEICGFAYFDCNENGQQDVDEDDFENLNMQLLNAAGNQVLAETLTDINGDFCFTGLPTGSFRVCTDEPNNAVDVTPATGCYDVTTEAFNDVDGLEFGLSVPDFVTVPVDVTVDCTESTFPVNTGIATGGGCSAPSITFTDVVTPGCTTVIRRTWSNNGATGVQTINVEDNDAPFITTEAVSQTVDCQAQDIAAWVASDGFAVCDDVCSSCTFTNNYNGVPVGPCNTVEVTFTGVDQCGLTTATTATYTTTDNSVPSLTLTIGDDSAECNTNGSDIAAYNAWLASFAGAQATDNCSSANQITFAVESSSGITSGCFEQDTVLFSATDACGNQSVQSATYTISDGNGPVITQEAANAGAVCDGGNQDVVAFEAWRTSGGNAIAFDTCTTTTLSDDYEGAPVSGCSVTTPVVFTFTDLCGQSASTSASFTVTDNAGPVINPQASNDSVECTGSDVSAAYQAFLASNGGASATDSCTSVTVSNDGPASVENCSGEVVTFTFFDACGNNARTTAQFSVIDSTDPEILTPAQDDSAVCDSNAQTNYEAWVTSNAGLVATDACNPAVTITNNAPATLTNGCSNAFTATFTISDACGNVVTDTATFSINDNADPFFTANPTSDSADCATNFQASYQSWLSSNAGAAGDDVCTTVSITNDGPATVPFDGCSGSVSVTFFLNDGCGNQITDSATYSVFDVSAPTVTDAVSQTVDCDGSGNTIGFTNWVNTNGGAVFSDTCSGVTVTNDAPATLGGNGCTAGQTVTFTGCDACNQCVATSATYTANDTDAPVFTVLPQDLTVQCDGNNNVDEFQAWLANNGGAVATDACADDSSLIFTNTNGAIIGCDFETVTFTVSDPCGNSVSATATFTSLDSIVPTIDPQAQSVVVECDGSGNNSDYAAFIGTRGGSVATDACAVQLTFTDNSDASAQPTTCPESQTVTFVVEDECGNSASTTATYSVTDTTAPVVQAASDTSVQCDRFSSSNQDSFAAWLANNGGATAFDTCSAVAFSDNSQNVQSVFDGCNTATTVTFTARDNCGNTASTTATFNVIDTTPPTLTTPASPLALECGPTVSTQISSWLAQNGGAVADDNCSSFVSSSNDFTTEPVACSNGTPVTFSFTDQCGLTVSSVGLLTIDDTEAPQFVPFVADVTVGCNQSTDPVTTGTPVVLDTCDSNPSLTFSDVFVVLPNDGFCPGDEITTRTWLTIDSCGNALAQDQVITQEIAESTGPCTPSECPPCGDQACCDTNLEPVPCNPVPCNPVSCTSVSCSSVPCNPVNCGGGSPVPVPSPGVTCVDANDDDDDDCYNNSSPEGDDDDECDPVYIYVFDDDEDVSASGFTRNSGSPSSSSSDASSVTISMVTIVALILAILA